jgi:hypothetical protein
MKNVLTNLLNENLLVFYSLLSNNKALLVDFIIGDHYFLLLKTKP